MPHDKTYEVTSEDAYASCEVSVFTTRDFDDWYYLEWWGSLNQWVVYKAPEISLVSCERGKEIDA